MGTAFVTTEATTSACTTLDFRPCSGSRPEFFLDLSDRFCASYQHVNPDFQTEHGYPPVAAGKADLRICTKYVASTFQCLAMTLEQPFKDSAITPEPVAGWSPGRCAHLGASALDALSAVIGDLR